jgi:hypothetical protein
LPDASSFLWFDLSWVLQNACSKGESLYFNFHQKWSKLGTLSQTDANEAEIKKKVEKLTDLFLKN